MGPREHFYKSVNIFICTDNRKALEKGSPYKGKMVIVCTESWSGQSALSSQKCWLRQKEGMVGRCVAKFMLWKFFLENLMMLLFDFFFFFVRR